MTFTADFEHPSDPYKGRRDGIRTQPPTVRHCGNASSPSATTVSSRTMVRAITDPLKRGTTPSRYRRRPMLVVLTAVTMLLSGGLLLRTSDGFATAKTLYHKVSSAFPLLGDGIRRVGEADWVSHDPRRYLVGPPRSRFRDNLRSDVQYITSWNYAGMTNDFMAWCNMIYLGLLSRRVPILGPLLPHGHHLGSGGLAMDFGKIFDVPRLSSVIQHPILEWWQVKKGPYNTSFTWENDGSSGAEVETIGCWSVSQTIGPGDRPLNAGMPHFLRFNVMYYPVPRFVKLNDYDGDCHASLGALAGLLRPEGRQRALADPKIWKQVITYDDIPDNETVWPNEQLACLDILYFTGVRYDFEWEKQSPVWDLVGTNAHFTKEVDGVTSYYMRRALGIASGQTIPPFISVHVRRSDFKEQCGDVPMDDCLAPLTTYAKRVNEIKAELARLNYPPSPLSNVTLVFLTSDEKEEAFWEEARKLGWSFIDYGKEEVAEEHGKWYPTIIDAVIQSRGAGFVGTRGSTMSLVASRRVQDWQNGPTRIVQWGSLNADAR